MWKNNAGTIGPRGDSADPAEQCCAFALERVELAGQILNESGNAVSPPGQERVGFFCVCPLQGSEEPAMVSPTNDGFRHVFTPQFVDVSNIPLNGVYAN